MSTSPDRELWSLTEKEKQTLRLMARGHDAKSIARETNLSVHTINERLRDARRKMVVASSREAARLLLAAEEATNPHPHSRGDDIIGDERGTVLTDEGVAPTVSATRPDRRPRILIGVIAMSLVLGLLALLSAPHPATLQAPRAAEASDPEVVSAARTWLMLVDEGRWEDSYRATGASFRELNTVAMWENASRKVRVPLGRTVRRTFVSQEDLPAPPDGYQVVKFRTRFANKAQDVIETVSLDREDGAWRVVGVYVG